MFLTHSPLLDSRVYLDAFYQGSDLSPIAISFSIHFQCTFHQRRSKCKRGKRRQRFKRHSDETDVVFSRSIVEWLEHQCQWYGHDCTLSIYCTAVHNRDGELANRFEKENMFWCTSTESGLCVCYIFKLWNMINIKYSIHETPSVQLSYLNDTVDTRPIRNASVFLAEVMEEVIFKSQWWKRGKREPEMQVRPWRCSVYIRSAIKERREGDQNEMLGGPT